MKYECGCVNVAALRLWRWLLCMQYGFGWRDDPLAERRSANIIQRNESSNERISMGRTYI